ncbi:MAG: serine/threonine protein kinase [Myxococcales bacterium]|nr:serine/threonine protein kinase [Myxococcales bacterium]MCB9649116.1 serine/threonine protein kinase [Deltaproteobacteria bacterium]
MSALGRFELLDRIGHGGMAEVYRARLVGPAGFAKTVVVKRILPRLAEDPLMVRMFVEEARIAAAADHDNIAKVYELGRTEDGQYFMVMEYIDGIDLELLLQEAARRELAVPTWFSVHVVTEILEALSFVHGLEDESGRPRNVIHRDATPSNIFISHQGRVKLSDFGVADFVGKSPTTQAGQLKGKLAYMSPEQLRAKLLDARADVFAMGVVLWETLTQERLFGHLNDMQAMMAICEEHRPAPSSRVEGLHPALDEICARATAADRDARYPSAQALQQDLLRVLHDLHPPVRPRDVRSVLDQLLGRRPPSPETRSTATAPRARAKSFLVDSDGPGVVPDLEATDSDSTATMDETQSPALAREVQALRRLAQVIDAAVDAPTPEGLLAPMSWPADDADSAAAAETLRTESGARVALPGDTTPPVSAEVRLEPPEFQVRRGPGGPQESLRWEVVVDQARRAGERGAPFEVSTDGQSYISLPELGRLTGQDLALDLEPPSNVTVVGSLMQHSLTAVLARAGLERLTGVLTVARPKDGAWYELEIHQGRPTRLITPLPEAQLPHLLLALSPLTEADVARLAHRALNARRPLADVAREAGGPDLGHAAFMRTRLQGVFGWTSGDYTLSADLSRPKAGQAFAPSLLTLLPELVTRTLSLETLTARLAPIMSGPLRPSAMFAPSLELFLPADRGVMERVVELPRLDGAPRAPGPRAAFLAAAYVLREARLAEP